MNNTIPIFDGHNDTLFDIYRPGRKVERSFTERSEHGHIDLPRARALAARPRTPRRKSDQPAGMGKAD